MCKVLKPRVCLTADPQPPLGVIDYIALALLILGALVLCSHIGFNLYLQGQGLPTETVLQQMMNVFLFVVIECVALVLLHAQGRTPYLDPKVLESFLNNTVGTIPKLLQTLCKVFTKSDGNQANKA